ncbi:MAG: helix-turn-helix transcriptional regulator [Rhodoplanes sp.]
MPRDLGDALDLFLAAATDSSLWSTAMDAVVEATGAYGAALFPIRSPLPNFPRSRSLEPATDPYLRNGWIHGDEGRAAKDVEQKGVTTEFDFSTPDEIACHSYYRDFLARHKLRWLAGVKVGAGEDLWYLSIQRTIDQGPFSSSEQQGLVAFSERLAGVAGLARAIRIAWAEGALTAFEATETAVVLSDCRCEVWRVNPSAETLFGPDLHILNRRLISADQDATAALDRALSELLWVPAAAATRRPIKLPRQNKRPILAYPIRLAPVTSDAFSPCQAIVVLIDLKKRARPPECDLRACFGLTAAEASLAIQIVSGDDLIAICNKSKIARETARAQLRSIFAKTGVHRQSELVALLSNITKLQVARVRPCEPSVAPIGSTRTP